MPRPPKHTVISLKEIGQRMKLLRQDRGLTQIELASQLEISQSNLSAIERGSRGLTVNQLVRIAKALRATTDEILFDTKAVEPAVRPSKKLMQRLRRVHELSQGDQRILLQLLDGLLSHREEKRRRLQARPSKTKVA